MIFYIRGRLKTKYPTYIIIETNGIGYEIHIPLSTYDKLSKVDSEIEVYTHLYVREDNLQLYGFKTLEERELFQQLISVSGVGPRVALGILSGLSIKEIKGAIGQENLLVLTSISGIGKKIAQRIILELKDKMDVILMKEEKEIKSPLETQLINEAIAALVSLGCKPFPAKKAVKQAEIALPKDVSLEQLVRQSLKLL